MRAGPGPSADEVKPAGAVDVVAVLRRVWTDLLGVEHVPDVANFFELGGHSMLATRVAHRVHAELGVRPPTRLVFDRPVFVEFAEAVLDQMEVDGAPAQASRAVEIWSEPIRLSGVSSAPLSAHQRELLRTELRLGMLPINNVAVPVAIGRAELPVPTARAVLRDLVRRHPMLRATFTVPPETTPDRVRQHVRPVDDVDDIRLDVVRISAAGSASDREVRRRIYAVLHEPFDLAAGAFRAQLLHRTDADAVLVLHLHHLVCDGASVQLMVDDIAALLRPESAARPEDPTAVTYLDYCQWQAERFSSLHAASAGYWRGLVRRLAEVDLHRLVGTDVSLPARIGRTAVRLLPEVLAEVTRWANGRGVSGFEIVAAAVAHAVAVLEGRRLVTIGCLLENRSHPGTERVVGPFACSGVLVLDHPDKMTAEQAVDAVRMAVEEAERWAAMPLEEGLRAPLEELGMTSEGLVDVVVTVDRFASAAEQRSAPHRLLDVGAAPVGVLLDAVPTLLAVVEPDGGLHVVIDHIDAAPARAAATRLLDAVAEALQGMADPTVPLPGSGPVPQ